MEENDVHRDLGSDDEETTSEMGELLHSSPESTDMRRSSLRSPSETAAARRTLFPNTDENEMVVPDNPGFTVCWDNVGKYTVARHQSGQRQNAMHMWAMVFASINRVPSTHLDWQTPHTSATDIPISKFLPDKEDFQMLRCRIVTIIQRILVKHLTFFHQHFADIPVQHIQHAHSAESAEKSQVLNLGVVQENPASASGTIAILRHIHKYVPRVDGKFYPTVVYGDQLSCERHNDAHVALANEPQEEDRLSALEPGCQEFHKRMLRLQDTMNLFFSGSSATDKGTLFWLKSVFNHRSVQKEVKDAFNHVSEFLEFVTEGYTLLLAMQILRMQRLDDRPQNAPDGLESACHADRFKFLHDIAEEMVASIWHDTMGVEANDNTDDQPRLSIAFANWTQMMPWWNVAIQNAQMATGFILNALV